MTILRAELKFYKSETVGDTGANGGRMSSNQIASGAAANIFPSVDNAERIAGSTKHRKVFAKVANDADELLANPRLYLEKFSSGADIVTFFAANQTDLQSGITGSENKYGSGNLNANVSAGASACAVLCEPGNTGIFRNGEVIRISDKTDIDDLSGNEEFVTITGAPTVAGDVVTIPSFTPALANAYLSSVTRVASVYEPADIDASISGFLVTSAGDGDYNQASLTADAIGGIEQLWTLTFTSATAFNIVGDTVGSVGTGSVGAGATPNNPAFTKPYFALGSAGFSGTWQSGDTIVFSTHPAAAPVWMRRVVPAGAAPVAASTAVLVLEGETA